MSSKELVWDYIHRVWNERDLTAIDEAFAPNAHLRSPLGLFSSPEGMKEIVGKWLERLPDLKVEKLALIEEGDLITCHWQAFSKEIDYQGVTLYRIKEGKIIDYWTFTDRVDL